MTEKFAHRMVAETAKGMAHEVYDELMKRDGWYSSWKNAHPGLGPKALETRWVLKNYGKFVEGARATLAGMLNSNLDESAKESIMEALTLDSTLTRGRRAGHRLIGYRQ